MNNYRNNNYALNRHSKGIVYKFADETIEIDLETYLTANTDKTAADFEALKALSDSDYYDEDRATYRQTYKDILCPEVDEFTQEQEVSAEETFLKGLDLLQADANHQSKIAFALQILEQLTEVQKRRYIMHRIKGLTTRQIAEIEAVNQSKIVKSVALADKKIHKILSTTSK